MKIQIKYSVSPLAKKGKDFLINPKGYGVKNDFANKSLIGDVIDTNKIGIFIASFKKLNPKFPIVSWKNLSVAKPTGITSQIKPSVTNQPPNTQLVSTTKPDSIDISKFIPTKQNVITEDKTGTFLPLLAVGIIAFIFYQRKK